ncbi:MAG: L,D-transpeptidase family protein [Lachnospiraceae bacterium]|nr:L,D-transpeptidase family protein [Lachnospiraceae bacterium]
MWKKVYVETVPETTSAEPAASEKTVAETPDGSTAETTAAETEIVRQPSWKKILSCTAYVGRNGIKKKREGDKKTPVGAFHITMAFGIKKSPGTAGISYTKLNKYYYWSGERDTYNTFVDVRDLGRSSVAGEHLISYKPFYNYSLAMDFNKKGVFKKGSAIFLHCTKPGRKYTAGCIAVAEKKMKKIVKNTTEKTMIFIYPK